jgi:hypothetical protein
METGTRHPSPGPIQPAHGPISLRTCSTVEHSLWPRGHSSVVVAPAPYVTGRPAAGSRPCRLLLSATNCQGMGMGVLAAAPAAGCACGPGSARPSNYEKPTSSYLFQPAAGTTGQIADSLQKDKSRLNRGTAGRSRQPPANKSNFRFSTPTPTHKPPKHTLPVQPTRLTAQ